MSTGMVITFYLFLIYFPKRLLTFGSRMNGIDLGEVHGAKRADSGAVGGILPGDRLQS